MSIEERLVDPVCIRVGKKYDYVMVDEESNEHYSLEAGVLFGSEHYGFILIIDDKGKQREVVYPTQCKIEAIGIEGGVLKVFEEGKRLPWTFDKKGKLESSAFNDFTEGYLREYSKNVLLLLDNPKMFLNKAAIEHPVKLRIAMDPEKSVIELEDGEKYPLFPGVMLDSLHYGFILLIETLEGVREIKYPTQCRIDAVGCDTNFYDDIKVFENGKYHPWKFGFDGKFKEIARFNLMSRRDQNFIKEIRDLNSEGVKDAFTLQKKK